MRRTIVIVLALALAALVLAGCSYSTGTTGTSGGSSSGGSSSGGSATAKTASVDISGFAFNPAEVTVAVGGTVTWKNSDSATHKVKGDTWGSDDLAQGATYSNTFDKAGTFAYSCAIHPSMTGTVIVK